VASGYGNGKSQFKQAQMENRMRKGPVRRGYLCLKLRGGGDYKYSTLPDVLDIRLCAIEAIVDQTNSVLNYYIA